MLFKNDAGYGASENISTYYFLYYILNDEQRKNYEKKLEKKDPIRYKEFKDWVNADKKTYRC